MIKEVRRKTLKIRPSGRSTDFISPSFGHGCLYDCSYCYMKRHKPYGLSIATNTEDILTAINDHCWFDDTEKPNQTHPKYITYDISCNDAFIDAGYDVHVNYSPIIVYDNWLSDYKELFNMMNDYVDYKNVVLSECIFLTHNENKHYDNLAKNPKTEKDLWKPKLQTTKQSQYGGINIRYKAKLKSDFIEQFKELHEKTIPWNKIRYIF